jgi:hypothetical protein
LCGYNHKIEKLEKTRKPHKLEITQVAQKKRNSCCRRMNNVGTIAMQEYL